MQRDEPYSIEPSLQFSETVHPPSVARILTRLGLSEVGKFTSLTTEQLVVMLRESRWERRASAATALGRTGTDASMDPLIRALQDEVEEVRAAAARALGRIGNDAAVSALITALRDSQSLVREAAATTLGMIGEPTAGGPLSLALQDEAEEVRAAAAQALGRVGNTTTTSLLVTTLQDPHPLVREAAAEALGELGDPSAQLALLAHVQDNESLVREAVGHALLMLEQPVSQDIIHLLFREKEESVQQMARSAVSLLVDLGFYVHEEEASIAPLVVALQSIDKEVEKIVVCYLIGRSLDVLNECIPLKPLLDTLHQGYQQSAVEGGIWKTLSSLAQEVLQERKILRLLVAATNDSDPTVRMEIDQAVKWLLDLALTLQEERGIARVLQTILEDKEHPARKAMICKLVKQALDALEEREPIGFFLADLHAADAERRAEVGKRLTRRARKALLGRMPGGALIISLKDPSESTPLQLQFGNDQESETDIKEGRYVFPWAGPSKLKLPSLPDKPKSTSLDLTLGNVCFQ